MDNKILPDFHNAVNHFFLKEDVLKAFRYVYSTVAEVKSTFSSVLDMQRVLEKVLLCLDKIWI